MLERAATKALSELPFPAKEAIYWDMKREDMPWPNAYEDQWAADQAEKARVDGWVTYGITDNSLTPNLEFGKVKRAVTAIQDLQKFLSSGDRSEIFCQWFNAEYDEVPPDLSNKHLWDQIF